MPRQRRLHVVHVPSRRRVLSEWPEHFSGMEVHKLVSASTCTPSGPDSAASWRCPDAGGCAGDGRV
eukprot:COSAG06_NODE_156_length_21863_cov_29.245405_16_plen_66_part_00